MKNIWGLFFLFFTSNAWSFPELVRHGYVNCNTCHVSVTGGGLLTPYGRALSKEVLSSGRFFFEKPADPKAQKSGEEDLEAEFFGGSVNRPEWLHLGGDIRALQAFEDTPKERSGQFVMMQADLEAMIEYKRLRVLGTIGRDEPRKKDPQFEDFVISRRHWISAQLGPEDDTGRYQLRGGRFFPAYGLNIPEHTIVTRQKLGFDQGQETYNLEAAAIGESFSFFATAWLGRPDSNEVTGWTGGSFQANYSPTSKSRVGVNIARCKKDLAVGSSAYNDRELYGVFGMLGFTESFYSLVELDHAKTKNSSTLAIEKTMTDFLKVGYEWTQGAHVFFTQEANWPSEIFDRRFEAYGLGVQYFPRPHWDFLTTIRKERARVTQSEFNTALWFVVHYYL